MKKGQIITVVIAMVVVVGLYLSSRTPESVTIGAEEAETEETAPELNNELDAKVAEAVAIIQNGDGPPMRAVGLLREVITLDSNHVGALYWLGEFSMMSGQYERAIERFEKLLVLEPDSTEFCIKLAQAFAGNGQNDQGVQVIETFKTTHPEQDVEQLNVVLEKISVELKN